MMDAVVKKSLGGPLRQLTCCVTGDKDAFSRKSKSVRRKSAPCCYGPAAHDSSWIRTYQAELHRERQAWPDARCRKLRQMKFAQKNAERAAMRGHYRSPHRFTTKPVQRTNYRSKAATKNDNSLFGAFQGLSLMGGSQPFVTSSSSSSSSQADPCKVM